MGDETRVGIFNDKEDKRYEESLNLLVIQRDNIGLVVSFDMGWQK